MIDDCVIRVTSSSLKSNYMFNKSDSRAAIQSAIDELGKKSALSQGLNSPITSFERMKSCGSSVCYIKFERGEAVGLLKVGSKQLFVSPPGLGSLKCINPLCVLDFYVSKQRSGHGKEIFDCMLAREGADASKLAYDRPSSKLFGFLKKYFGLSKFVPQSINFVIFDEYYKEASASSTRPSTASVIELPESFEPITKPVVIPETNFRRRKAFN